MQYMKTMFHRTLYRKLRIEQHELDKTGVKSSAMEG